MALKDDMTHVETGENPSAEVLNRQYIELADAIDVKVGDIDAVLAILQAP